MVKGLVNTDMPASICPWLRAADRSILSPAGPSTASIAA